MEMAAEEGFAPCPRSQTLASASPSRRIWRGDRGSTSGSCTWLGATNINLRMFSYLITPQVFTFPIHLCVLITKKSTISSTARCLPKNSWQLCVPSTTSLTSWSWHHRPTASRGRIRPLWLATCVCYTYCISILVHVAHLVTEEHSELLESVGILQRLHNDLVVFFQQSLSRASTARTRGDFHHPEQTYK